MRSLYVSRVFRLKLMWLIAWETQHSVYICVLDMIIWTNWWKDELRDICSLLRNLLWLIICISWECSMLMRNAIPLHGYWLPNVSHVDAFTLDLLKVLWPSCFCIRKIHRRPSGHSQETFGSLLFTGDLRVIHRRRSGQIFIRSWLDNHTVVYMNLGAIHSLFGHNI